MRGKGREKGRRAFALWSTEHRPSLTHARPPLAGDAVATDELVAQIETDKVTMDVRAPAAGVVDTVAARPRC